MPTELIDTYTSHSAASARVDWVELSCNCEDADAAAESSIELVALERERFTPTPAEEQKSLASQCHVRRIAKSASGVELPPPCRFARKKTVALKDPTPVKESEAVFGADMPTLPSAYHQHGIQSVTNQVDEISNYDDLLMILMGFDIKSDN